MITKFQEKEKNSSESLNFQTKQLKEKAFTKPYGPKRKTTGTNIDESLITSKTTTSLTGITKEQYQGGKDNNNRVTTAWLDKNCSSSTNNCHQK